MDNKKEVNIDASQASVGKTKVQSAKISAEQVRNIYPEEDPRKFNTHVDEQEVAEYLEKDHSQPVTGENSADKEHIRPAREEKEAPQKDYPKPEIWAIVSQGALTIGSLFLINQSVFMFICAFGASLFTIPNHKLLSKKYPRLGFNPLKALMIFDGILMLFAIVYWLGDIIGDLIGDYMRFA